MVENKNITQNKNHYHFQFAMPLKTQSSKNQLAVHYKQEMMDEFFAHVIKQKIPQC
jgi:hypothetical protein